MKDDGDGGVSGEAQTLPSPADAVATPAGPACARLRTIGPGVRLGRFEIVEELGVGGMATVWRARDTELRRDVAVKVLLAHLARNAELVARFQREARAAASLEHRHILRVYDVGGGPAARAGTSAEDPAGEPGELDPPYMVLELIRGRSLKDVAADLDGPLDAELCACVGAVICSALAVAHRAGIIHRDVKPANILAAEGGRLVLGDFGVARVEDEDSLVTRSGALLGTPAFMSPEQALGGRLDPRSDLYSLGATLYQLASGSLPFSGPTPRVVAAIAAGERVEPLRRNPRMGPDLADVIERLMAREPADRYDSADAARAALLEVTAPLSVDDPDAELGAYFADPAAWTGRRRPQIVAGTLGRARAAVEARRIPRALALADRVLALEPDSAEAAALVERLRARRRWPRWVAASAGAAAAALIAMWAWPGGPATPVGQASALADAAAVSHAGAHDAALALAAPADAAPAPTPTAAADALPVRAVRAEPRPPRISAAPARPPPDAGVAPAVARILADAAPAAPRIDADAALAPAQVTLLMNAWCDVTVGGRPYGRARADQPLTLAPGTHTITCSQGAGMAEWSSTVRLRPGQHARLEGDLLGQVTIRVALKAADEVRIGDRAYPSGSTVRLRPGRHRITLLRAGKQTATAWLTVPRVASCTLVDEPVLECYR